jgi:hypothetical protein
MEELRARDAASRRGAPSAWRAPLAAAALVLVALGAAALVGVNPGHDLGELAALAGDATASMLGLPGGP